MNSPLLPQLLGMQPPPPVTPELINLLKRAEDRLTRNAKDERDLDVLRDLRAVIRNGGRHE